MRMSIVRSPFVFLLPSSSYSLLQQTLRTATSTLNNSAWFARVGRSRSSFTRYLSTAPSFTDARMNQSSNHNNRVALLQFHVSQSKEQNHIKALDFMTRAVTEGKAQLLVLPEIWNSPYAVMAFAEFAEVLPSVGYEFNPNDDSFKHKSPSAWLLMQFAKQYGVYLVGGSIPECVSTPDHPTRLYNTCLCIDPQGKVIAKHRKVHLFDIHVPGKITFRESDTLTPGDNEGKATFFDTDQFGRIGVGICYDIRFPEYALLLTNTYYCNILVYPGAFNLTTGPAHWELLQRARAVDGQCFVLTASPARSDPPPSSASSSTMKYPHYSAWGHSTVVSPWGDVLATCDEKEAIVYCDLDMTKVEEMRQSIPTRDQKRHDIYRLVAVVE